MVLTSGGPLSFMEWKSSLICEIRQREVISQVAVSFFLFKGRNMFLESDRLFG